jgi:hypothetical protein
MIFLELNNDQQQSVVLEQQQSAEVPLKAPRMIPAEQPTPAVTESASKAQLRLQAPHSMQASRSVIVTFPLLRANTP